MSTSGSLYKANFTGSKLQIERILNYLQNELDEREENSTDGEQSSKKDFLTDPSEIVIIIGIFGLWFYSIGRIYVVWKNILNFSSDPPSPILSWNSLIYYIRNLKKSNSNEVIKEEEEEQVIPECPESPTMRNPGEDNHLEGAIAGQSLEVFDKSISFTSTTEITLTPTSLKETLIL